MSPELKSRIAASTLTILLCCALASVVLIFTLSPFTQAKPTSETLIDTIKYQRLMSYRMQSVEDLEEWFIAERDSLLPVAPPSEDFILRQSFGSGVIPYDGEDFPAEFNRGLIAVYEYSVPIYPVTIGEDPITRNVVFLNAKNEIIYSLAPPKNYDPYEYAKYLYPLLEMGVYPDWWVEWQLALWDPARIQICTKLIATENLEHYLFAEKTVAELALSLPASGGGLLMMSGGGGGSNDLWLSINGPVQGVTNGIEVVAHIPEGFTNRLEIYSCTNLLDCWWTVEVTNLPSAGTNPVIWMNTNIGSVSRQCYVAGNADIDSDLDTLPNAREVLVHHTSATNADTDADGATDGQELQAGTDPLVNPGDADSDGLSDHLEIVLGTLTDSADTDLDWAGDGYEFEEGTDPLDPSDVPPLRVIVNAEQVYAPSTNLSISFPGLVAEDAQVSELPDFSNPETVSVTGQAVYALMHSTNGWRSLFARMRRPTNEISRTLSSVLILDTGSPVLTSITPTNNHVTARRWVRIEGTATDAVSSVRVLINGKWADGVSTGTFYDARFTLESGTNIVSVVALDRAGHSATQTLEVVQDASFDTTAPSIAFSMPCDYEIVGATTNWFQCTTFGADKSLYLRGEIDDETAFVFTMVESDGQTNGPYMGIVNGTQVWSIVSLFPGTNTLSLVAQDAAGNSSTATHTVVRNTNFFLRITDPLPYENMDSRSTLVYGVASTVFVDATIRVNDVQVNITDNTTNVTFVTSQCVPLNLGLTRIFGVAELEGQSFYVDPQVVGYEVLKDVGSYEIAINEISGEPDGEGYSEIQSENGDYQWTAQNGLAFSRWTNTTTECWWGDGWSTCETTENGSSGSWEKNSVGSLFGFGFASVVDEGKSSTREWREEDLYHYDERVTFKKHWPSQEVQNVIFQFGGLYSGYFVAGPPDPTELTYRGQTGFWYNGNAAFIVPIEMETEYILGASDFTWPITSKLILSDASGEWWENSHFLGFSSFTNHPLSVQMVPDYDHDGDIDDDDRAIQGSGQPFYFWENDDDDQTSDAKTGGDSDVPGVGSADSGNSQVDGTRDLIDFFPVFLDLKDVLDLFGTTDFKYALHEPGGINFLYTDLTPANAGNYLTDQTTAEDLADDTLNEITGLGNGVQLSQSFLSDIQNNGKGIVLVEAGYATTYPLVLNILDSDNRIIFTNELALSISGVEDMYRWVNLRAAGGGSVSRSTDTSEPGNYPDSICNGKHFVFVHGYSVNEQQARGWNAEIFKRLYHAGSHAMFTAVTWFGNDSQITGWLPWFGDLTPNYYINVEHAFETADELDTAVSALSGQKYIAGHSLGNMLVSSAIVDHGLSVSAYFMLNAAVAMESYNPSLIYRDDMGHPDWESYSNRLWASDWHLLFDPSDGRGDLTWRGRFNGISGVRNYYSSGEDVLNNSTGAVPDIGNEYVWASEEMLKGTWLITVGPGNSEAGWGFNSDYNGLTATQANALADATLMTNSFFKHFDDEDLYGTNGSTIAQQPAMYGQLLADGIPAISYAAGRNSISSAAGSGNADMNSMENGWPTVRTSNPDYGSRWLHSDIKNIAYPYVQEVFNDIASKGLR